MPRRHARAPAGVGRRVRLKSGRALARMMLRDALALWLPAALAFAGVLGPALLAGGRLSRRAAQRIALASLVALAVYATLVVLLPLGPGETQESRWYPALDAVLAGALVALAALGVGRAWIVPAWTVAVLAVARAAGVAVSLASTQQLTMGALTGLLLWVAAALLAVVLGLIRWRAARPASPGGTTRAGSRRS